MRIQDLLRMAGDYLRLGAVLLVIALLIFFAGYLVIYKVLCKGEKRFDFKKLFWWIVLILYLFVVGAVTLFRPAAFGHGQIVSFFYSYKEAWISGSTIAWRNIILNILMFVPLGFWLPIGKKQFRVFWRTYLLGLMLTVGIECFQLFLARGIFEVADICNNTVGTMIGYGCYKAVEYVILLWKRKNGKLSHMLAAQIPLVLAVCAFAGILWAYGKQELGKLPIESISPYPKGTFQIVSEEIYSEEISNEMVYQAKVWSTEETEAFAKNFFEDLGTTLDESRNDEYENTAFYWAKDTYSMRIDYKGGTYYIHDYDISFPEEGEVQPRQVADATEETILKALLEYHIRIPEGAIFSYDPDLGYMFTVDRVETDGNFFDGILTCNYYDNGKFSDIRNDIVQFEAYKEFEICSEQEAYEQILDGKFVCSVDAGEKMEVGPASRNYLLDSKGFYQPVYHFSVAINGEEQSILIPAIK